MMMEFSPPGVMSTADQPIPAAPDDVANPQTSTSSAPSTPSTVAENSPGIPGVGTSGQSLSLTAGPEEHADPRQSSATSVGIDIERASCTSLFLVQLPNENLAAEGPRRAAPGPPPGRRCLTLRCFFIIRAAV